MSKCNRCKYEYLSKIEEPCKYCRERFGVCTPNYMMHEDKFQPKEEQSTTEYNGCNDCYYEWLGESDAPCCECKHRFEPGTMARLKAKDCFKPKEEKECMKCIYSNLSEFELPCCECKYNIYDIDTNYKKTKDCFKPNEKGHSSNCTISVKECNKAFKNEDYGFEEISNDEIDMVNHPPHYQHGIEPIEFIESHDLNFNLGNVIKYVSRAPYKGNELEDLKKAKWYLEREINKHDN